MTRKRPAAAIATVLVALLPAVAGAAEIGPNDFRVSHVGPDGDVDYRASTTAVAYNDADDSFIVVWSGEDSVEGELEIHGRLFDAAGLALGAEFTISDMGDPGDPEADAFGPSVAYNPDRNEFLVVWVGDDDTFEREVFAQRLDGSTGNHVGSNDFQISDIGPMGSPINGADTVDVTYNAHRQEYLVVWGADEGLGGLGLDESEIYGQRLTGLGVETGANDFRISDMGPDGNDGYRAGGPQVAHNTVDDEYLVIWLGDDDTGPLVDEELEVFGQRLSADGVELGGNDFRISDMGPDGDSSFDASFDEYPALAYNPVSNEYLAVWEGNDGSGAMADNEIEIFAQRLSAGGAEVGANDFRISMMGPDGDPSFIGNRPSVGFDPRTGGFLVAWAGSDHAPPLADDEYEMYAQHIGYRGGLVGDRFRISDMGPDGDPLRGAAFGSEVAIGSVTLVVWVGDDAGGEGGAINDEFEVWGQLLLPDVDTVGLVDVGQGMWHLRDQAGDVTSFFYGNPGDLPIAGDWNGNGDATPGLYRQSDGFFYSRDSNTQGPADDECFAGNPEDVPVVGDWDGDGDDNLGIYRPSQQMFYLFTTTCTGSPMGAAQISFLFGNPGDKPVAGDWDGDGVDEVGLHRESTGFFYWRNTLDTGIADGQIFFGDPGDRFVSGDWGLVEGADTPAVYRPSDQTFYFRHTLTQGIADSQFPWAGAGAGWLPVAGFFALD